MSKGLTLHDLLPAIIIVVIIILAASFSSSILSSIQQTQCNSTSAGAAGGWDSTTGACRANGTSISSNITGTGLTTLTNITSQMPNIGLILIVAVIIGILIGSFLVYQSRRG